MTPQETFAIIITVAKEQRTLREWRNRQTRTFEGRVVIPYGFKSRLSHQTESGRNSRSDSFFFGSFVARDETFLFPGILKAVHTFVWAVFSVYGTCCREGAGVLKLCRRHAKKQLAQNVQAVFFRYFFIRFSVWFHLYFSCFGKYSDFPAQSLLFL